MPIINRLEWMIDVFDNFFQVGCDKWQPDLALFLKCDHSALQVTFSMLILAFDLRGWVSQLLTDIHHRHPQPTNGLRMFLQRAIRREAICALASRRDWTALHS
jgi:hypothetical protein